MFSIVDSSTAKLLGEIRMLFWGFFFFYLFIRKKLRFLLFLGIAFWGYSLISSLLATITQGISILLLVGLSIIALIFGFREIDPLDKSGKRVSEILKWDKFDSIVLVLLLISWVLLRIFVLNK